MCGFLLRRHSCCHVLTKRVDLVVVVGLAVLSLSTSFALDAPADALPSVRELQDLGLSPKPPDGEGEQTSDRVPPRDPLIKVPSDPGEWGAWRDTLAVWREEAKAAVNYDDSLYRRSDLTWAADNYASCFVMMSDRDLWDPARGVYAVESLVERGIREFGGYDSVVLWHAYPRIGIDDRNQFDFYRDMPGGIEGLKGVVQRFHALNVKVFIDYNPWDTGTRREPLSDLDTLAEFLKLTGADGVYLDTMETGSSEFREKLDAVRPGLVLEGEGKLPVKNIHDHHMSWCEWCSARDSAAPGVLRDKWFERRHMMHQNHRWETDHTSQLHIAWMNGSGILIWENVFGSWVGWPERDKSLIRSMLPILRRYTPLFTGDGWTPLVPAVMPNVYASLWQGQGLRLWTLINRAERTPAEGVLLRAPHVTGVKYYDLFTGHEADVRIEADEAVLLGEIMPRGLAGFVSGTPETLGEDFKAFLDSMAALHARENRKLDYPGRMAILKPVERTKRIAFEAVPNDMATIRGTTYNGVTQMRVRECGFYDSATNVSLKFPNLHTFQTFPRMNTRLSSYAVDKTLVTNRQYLKFLESTGYKPRFSDSFLRHWVDGKPTEAQMDHPVVYVDLDDARAYARWAGKRLLTEEEWQYAAEGPEGFVYPWGNEWKEGVCNGRRLGGSTNGTTPVQAFPEGRSPSGIYDMCGNVYEWTESERDDGRTRFCMLRGGSYYQAEGSMWYTDGGAQPCSHAEKFILMWPGLDRCATIGFRCALDLAEN